MHRVLNPFWKRVVRDAGGITSPSRWLAGLIDENLGRPAGAAIIPNGIDDRWIEPSSGGQRILFVSRLLPRKGAQFLLKAVETHLDDRNWTGRLLGEALARAGGSGPGREVCRMAVTALADREHADGIVREYLRKIESDIGDASAYEVAKLSGVVRETLEDETWAEALLAEADTIDARHAVASSFAGRIGRVVEPVFAPIGADWQISIGVITSFAAREVFVSTLAVIFAGSDDAEDTAVLERIKGAERDDGSPLWTNRAAAGVLVFYVLAMVPLGLHLYHGIWSACQTLDINNPRIRDLRRPFSAAVALAIVVGNCSIPLSVLAGWVG